MLAEKSQFKVFRFFVLVKEISGINPDFYGYFEKSQL